MEEKNYVKKINGKERQLFILQNGSEMRAVISSYGGRLISLLVPDKINRSVEVIAGFNNAQDLYCVFDQAKGAITGFFRVPGSAARMATDASVPEEITSRTSEKLPDIVWQVQGSTTTSVELYADFIVKSARIPFKISVKLIYLLTADNCLKLKFEAKSEKRIYLDLHHHVYFNLNGQGNGNILLHKVQFKADKFFAVNDNLLPAGPPFTVDGTPFDFRRSAYLVSRIYDHNEQLRIANGYHHLFALNKFNMASPAATVRGNKSQILLSVYTKGPAINFCSGSIPSSDQIRGGARQTDSHTVFLLETRHLPNNFAQPELSNTELLPTQIRKTELWYKFTL